MARANGDPAGARQAEDAVSAAAQHFTGRGEVPATSACICAHSSATTARSCASAGLTTAASRWPRVSTTRCSFRPFTRLAPSQASPSLEAVLLRVRLSSTAAEGLQLRPPPRGSVRADRR